MRIAALSATLLLAGCMSLAPKYERPAAPVAGSFAAMSRRAARRRATSPGKTSSGTSA